MRESENKKRTLEENIDSLREECAKLKTAEHVSAVNAEEKEKAEQLRSMFDNQMDELRDAHTKQVAELRDEISEKQDSINELKEYVFICRSNKVYLMMLISLSSNVHSFNQKLTLTHQQMTTDYEKLRQEETDKSSKLQELMSVPPNNCYQSLKNNKHNVSPSSPLSVSSPYTSPSRIVNCLSPKKQQNCAIADNMLLDEFDIDEQNFNKIRKNFFNTQCQHHSHPVHDDDNYKNIDDVYTMKKHHHNDDSQQHPNSKSLLSTLCRTIPLALPTLQLHLLISLTMVLLTHRCPQYLIVL